MDEIKKLIGLEVTVISLSYQVDFIFLDDEARGLKHVWLRIEESFQLEVNGDSFDIDQNNPATLSPVTQLLRTTITEVSLQENYQLTLLFSNGIKLTVIPKSGYEAWELQGEGIQNFLAN